MDLIPVGSLHEVSIYSVSLVSITLVQLFFILLIATNNVDIVTDRVRGPVLAAHARHT